MIIGFSLTQLSVERHTSLQGNIGVKNDLNIRDVQEQPLAPGVGSNQKAVNFAFVFTVSYTPHVADITILGNVLYAAAPKTISEILSTWKEKKKVSADISVDILNFVLHKCNIRALELAQEFNLPLHIPMPKVNLQQKTANAYIG